MAQKILVIDDEAILVETIQYNLEQAGYDVVTASDGVSALEVAAEQKNLSLIILDLMLPKLDGIEVCRRLRREKETATLPILMLSAKSEEIDKVIGLEVGADDYLTKPFGRRELLSRVRALLRRADYPSSRQELVKQETNGEGPLPSRPLLAGPLHIDLAGRRVYCRNQEIDIQPKQYDLLVYFIQNRGTVLTRDRLLHYVWGYDYSGDTRTVDVHVRWLREKIEEEPANPKIIQTVRGVGYVLR